jgi:membrane protease YdiL (CAAX protease family)
MKIDPTPFERYRQSPNQKTTLPRLIVGAAVIALFWLAVTGAVMFAGVFGYDELAALFGLGTLTFEQGGATERFLASPVGVVAALATFAGIWLGVWVAMRAIHGERLGRLFGNSGRISLSGFAKGLIAVLVTSVLTEIGFYLLVPEIGRGQISLSSWLVFLVPMLFLAFVQTSSEELLFRGYLMRGLAYRFRSPLVWALLPALVFTALHWNANSVLVMNIGVLISIGAFAALLVVLVYATGNLGAAMGAHLGNNLVGFLLVSHEDALGSFALFRSPPLDKLAWTAPQAVAIVAMSIAAIVLTLLLLLHQRSPLKVEPDLGHAGDPQPPNPPATA